MNDLLSTCSHFKKLGFAVLLEWQATRYLTDDGSIALKCNKY